jgi:acyl-CoA thioester hydrolase
MADNGAPSQGHFRGKTHVLPVRVYYEDTDFSGVVYHASYLRFMERGRTDALRLLGVSHAGLWAEAVPIAFTVRRMAIEFLKPARIDDALSVETRFLALKGASLEAAQAVRRGDETLVGARLLVAIVGASGKPRRPSEALRQALAPMLERAPKATLS